MEHMPFGGVSNPHAPFENATGTPLMAPYSNGVDDTENLRRWLAREPGRPHMFPVAGGHPWLISEPLEPPAESWIEGENPAAVELIRKGNGDTFRLSGGSTLKNLYIRAATPQANGAAIDFSHHNSSACRLERIQLGNNFFNGFFLVAEPGLGSFGNLHIKDIEVSEPGSRAKGWGNAVFVMGNGEAGNEKRTIAIFLYEIYIAANTVADIPAAFKIANTDSLHIKTMLAQNVGTMLRFGEGANNAADASVLRTTNTLFEGIQADGCTTGYWLESLLERHQWGQTSAEGGATGALCLGNVSGVKWSGSSLSHNTGNGFRHIGGARAFANSFTGGDIVANGEAGFINEAAACGWALRDNNIGNFEGVGPATQKAGIQTTAAKAAMPLPRANRFRTGGVGANLSLSAENVPTAAEIEAANQME